MSNDPQGFTDLVAEYDDFADGLDMAFRPSDIGAGEYTVMLARFDTSLGVKNDIEHGIAKVNLRILQGEREGDSFTDQFWFPRGATENSFAQRAFLLLARCVAGRAVMTTEDAMQVLTAAVESQVALVVAIEASHSKKSGTTYFNVVYKERVDQPTT